MLINEAGRSRQIEISPLGLRVGLAAACGAVFLVIVAAIAAGGYLMSGSELAGDQGALTRKVAALEEELRKKELALTVQEKRLKEMQELPTMLSGPSKGTESERSGEAGSVDSTPRASDHGPLTAMRPAESGSRPGEDSSSNLPLGSETTDSPVGDSRPSRYAERETPESPGDSTTPPSRSKQTADIIEFNAEDVTAVATAPNSGVLRFKLIKSRPSIRFSGYLFVYVEMEDGRGESRLYAYPKEARRGEEDLPVNFREGESVAFHKNSLVELPYKDSRAGAALAGVSILIYDADGKIVFQRRFDRKDLKVVESGQEMKTGAGPSRGQRRRAL